MDEAIDFAVRHDDRRQCWSAAGTIPLPEAPGQLRFRYDQVPTPTADGHVRSLWKRPD